jgi:hypothetical protein
VLHAIRTGDAQWVERLVARHPALRACADVTGKPLAEHARASGVPEIARMFDR